MVSTTDLPTKECRNSLSARTQPDVVSELIEKEVFKGFLYGPFKDPPFQKYRIERFRKLAPSAAQHPMKCPSSSDAIGRLGGQQMKQECDNLKTKPVDQTNQEIMKDIKRSNDDLKKSLEVLQEQRHKEMTSQQDTVPWFIRARIKDILKDWMDNDTKFINTRAAQYVLKSIKEKNCVTITASAGVGKSATLRHVALQMAKEGYDVLTVTDPGDILKFCDPTKKTLFVIDDLCGNFAVDQSDIKRWLPIMEDLKNIQKYKVTKIIAACRLQVYQDEKFQSLSVFKSCTCNLLSEHLRLSRTEKQLIAKLYLKTKSSAVADFQDLYDCFPLLCKLYHDDSSLDITNFFQHPFSVYKAEIDKLCKKGYYTKYCALALCVMLNNNVKEEMLTEDVNEETRLIIENTCEACKLERGTSRLDLLDELNSLKDTFIIKEHGVYKAIHEKIFDFLSYYYGQKIISYLIKYADSDFIKNRFLVERNDCIDQFITIIPTKYHQMYIQRMINDWSIGKAHDVFSNINMKIPQFRQKFLFYLNTLNVSFQRQLAHMSDKYNLRQKHVDERDDGTYDNALLHCCYIGDISFVLWCFFHGVNVNNCSYKGQSPIMIACEHGHTKIVKMLLELGADCNKCDKDDQSLIMIACEHGHTDIVKILLDLGADYIKCDKDDQSPIMIACENGHTNIVKMLLDLGTDYNKCDKDGQSPIMKACEHGDTEIVKTLLDRGADYTKCDKDGQSPMMKACENGHTNIVKMLLVRGADYNKCDKDGQSPIMKACEHGHTELVTILLDLGADCNKCDKDDQSPIMIACEHGHTNILKMLIVRGADYNKCDKDGQSPIMIACEHGHTEIVKILLDLGADCNKCDKDDQSPIMIACEHGHTNIVKMLLVRGADYNKCDKDGQSPIMIACEHGHTEIVKILLDLGADYTKCDKDDQSPIMIACEHGHTDIVKILLDLGADYTKCDKDGQSPIMIACENGHTNIVKMLLDLGTDYNKCDKDGQSPIMKACEHGHTEIVKILLELGTDYTKCDKDSQSPIMKACEHGHTDIVKTLLDRGADYTKCDKDGQSTMMKACENGHINIVKMLLVRGADYNKCDKDGQSPIMKACEHGHIKIVKILLDLGADYTKCDKDGK
ncbi:ankyrin-3-like [Mytilus edulis]|uniref:ankyrin-3-like n=1 Tax=Mytilus edulis TaxID=6550 RepID=UPI0039EF3209